MYNNHILILTLLNFINNLLIFFNEYPLFLFPIIVIPIVINIGQSSRIDLIDLIVARRRVKCNICPCAIQFLAIFLLYDIIFLKGAISACTHLMHLIQMFVLVADDVSSGFYDLWEQIILVFLLLVCIKEQSRDICFVVYES